MDIQLFQHHLFYTVLSQLNCLGTFVEKQVTVYVWSSSRLFHSINLYIYLPVIHSWLPQLYFILFFNFYNVVFGFCHTYHSFIGEGNGNPLHSSCLDNPVDRGAWWAAVHRVAQSRTWLKWLSMHACIGEGNGNPLQCSCLENPRDRGAWWVAVYGITQSRTRLQRLSSSSHSFILSLEIRSYKSSNFVLFEYSFACFVSIFFNL